MAYFKNHIGIIYNGNSSDIIYKPLLNPNNIPKQKVNAIPQAGINWEFAYENSDNDVVKKFRGRLFFTNQEYKLYKP